MFESVDLYCERLGPEFWAEPVNAMTNLSFIVGAWFGWLKGKRPGSLTPEVWSLLALMCTIGLGSFLFHTVANGLTRLLDVLPILVFQLTYVWFYCRNVIEFRPGTVGALIIIFLVAAIIGRQFPHILNGSLIYAPAIIMLSVTGAYHVVTRRNQPYTILTAAIIFLISLLARTVDNAVCPYFDTGTHFLWHLLNGLVLFMLVSAYLANRVIETNTEHAIQPTAHAPVD